MVVAFEGMDGVGKTSTAQETAKILEYKYVDKIIQDTMQLDELSYLKLVKQVRTSNNNYTSAIFFVLKMILDNDTKENRIVNRSLLSFNYFEKNNLSNEDFAYIVKLGVVPDLTIILYASAETRYNRIASRNPNDSDLVSNEALNDGYREMLEFAKKYNIPYIGINTEKFKKEEVVDLTTRIIKAYEKMPLEYRQEYISLINSRYGFEELYYKPIQRRLK